MGNAIKQIFSLAVLIGIIYGGFWIFKNYREMKGNLPPGLTLYDDGTATFTGTVSTNEVGCREERVTHCFLTAVSGGKKVRVYYNTNNDYFCGNEKAASMGLAAETGMKVRANGVYRKVGDDYTINTCAKPEYYITTSY